MSINQNEALCLESPDMTNIKNGWSRPDSCFWVMTNPFLGVLVTPGRLMGHLLVQIGNVGMKSGVPLKETTWLLRPFPDSRLSTSNLICPSIAFCKAFQARCYQ